MDRKAYTAKLAALRELRAEIGAAEKAVADAQRALGRLGQERGRRVMELAAYEGAKADAIAKAGGLSVGDVVRIAPLLDPTPPGARVVRADDRGAAAVPAPAPPDQTPPAVETAVAVAPAPTRPAAAVEQPPVPAPDAAAAPAAAAVAAATAPAARETEPGVQADSSAAAPVVVQGQVRVLPHIPQGPAGDRFAAVTSGLVSTRPNFVQQPRVTVFLDAATGDLVAREYTLRLDLGAKSPGEILDAVLAAAPGTERVYVTAGAPWHEGAERYSTLKDAVAAWLHTPSQRWTTATGRGRDKLAGHFVHQRQPVGRYAPAAAPDGAMVEIRWVGEWFDADGADPALCRDAFRLLWQALRRHWDDVVLMGSPSQTGRDLWTRTIPTKGKWAGGYPVMSEELRALLHATGGQGRSELMVPPRVPERLPGLVEFDATFAYGKQTWKSGVGAPRRVTARAFAAMDEGAQAKALMACSHWHVRVTVPAGWEHVGLLPAPVPGERAWEYPATGGATFTTWAGGAEVHLALTNHLMPWRIEVLDGLVWEDGKPLDDWAKRLKAAWADLTNLSTLHGDERQRTAAYLASRAVRSILLFGIGGFAQRPRTVGGSTPVGEPLPAGVEILGQDDRLVTWQRSTGFSRDPNAHPEWAARVWSGARTALLSMRMREDDVMVGALHLPPASIVAFRTDAIYTTADVTWPYHGQPGEFLKKGHLPGPVPAPATLDELLALRDLGRAHFARGGER
ncbi:Mucin-19 [Kitasatospora nipponensis]|uniref:Mucin-19 n=1 Tax=Kitasatospora nipponensis TaxID=258049 RepID=A0ABN1W7Z4_9ACTN